MKQPYILKIIMAQGIIFLLAAIVGFFIFYILTSPGSSVHKRLPKLKIWRLQLFPTVRLSVSGKIIHLHHWLGFSIILVVSIFIDSGILSHLFTKGVLSGGIVQGLFTPQCFRLVYKKEDSKD